MIRRLQKAWLPPSGRAVRLSENPRKSFNSLQSASIRFNPLQSAVISIAAFGMNLSRAYFGGAGGIAGSVLNSGYSRVTNAFDLDEFFRGETPIPLDSGRKPKSQGSGQAPLRRHPAGFAAATRPSTAFHRHPGMIQSESKTGVQITQMSEETGGMRRVARASRLPVRASRANQSNARPARGLRVPRPQPVRRVPRGTRRTAGATPAPPKRVPLLDLHACVMRRAASTVRFPHSAFLPSDLLSITPPAVKRPACRNPINPLRPGRRWTSTHQGHP
jgi:hypothetical protein